MRVMWTRNLQPIKIQKVRWKKFANHNFTTNAGNPVEKHDIKLDKLMFDDDDDDDN